MTVIIISFSSTVAALFVLVCLNHYIDAFLLSPMNAAPRTLAISFAIKGQIHETKPKGFGSSPSPGSNSRNTVTEDIIQSKITAAPGLREAMTLEDEIHRWDISFAKLSLVDQALVSQRTLDVIKTKSIRLAQLRSEGWTDLNVRNKLHEFTWDASADVRHKRHQSIEISKDMNAHMLKVSKWALEHSQQPSVCDVGCGTGILVKFLCDYAKVNKVVSFEHASVTGIDLSGEMIKVAKATYPTATFTQSDFLAHCPSTRFSAVVMNECLHNFMDVTGAIRHAAGLLADNGRIIVSHPKGYENVALQASKNRLLAPSLLPEPAEWRKLADVVGLQVLLEPDVKSPHYLAVLAKGD